MDVMDIPFMNRLLLSALRPTLSLRQAYTRKANGQEVSNTAHNKILASNPGRYKTRIAAGYV